MARHRDLAGFFEQLTRRGSGGRRADTARRAVRDAIDAGGRAARRAAERARPSGPFRPGARRPGRPPEGVVHVEYSPRIDGDPDPGEVVWTWVPYEEDPTRGKDRPVVIIGRRGSLLVGVPLTTQRDDREAQVAIGTGGWDPQRRESYARVWRMLDIDPDRMRREGAILARDRFAALVDAVDHYYEVVHPS